MTEVCDIDRMCADRLGRLREEMAADETDALILLHGPHVTYATGLPPLGVDVSVANHVRSVAIVTPEGPPHLATARRDHAVRAELHRPVWPELDDGVPGLADLMADVIGPLEGKRIGVDETTGAMQRSGVLSVAEQVDASRFVGAARLTKTPDEVACIAEAQVRTQQAMLAAYDTIAPGVRRSEVAGAFLAALRRQGDDANMIDPIFEPMARRIADGPRTTTGDVAFPTGVDDPTFAEGDLIWVDAGVAHLGYASDFGRTWIVGRDPNDDEQRLYEQWRVVMDATFDAIAPGATLGDVGRAAVAANDGVTPWLPHFYLAHGVGVDSAEMPMVGTDLGPDFDDGFVLAPGMILVLEPVIWEDGVGSYRAEEVVVVTEEGWQLLGGGHPYAPFDDRGPSELSRVTVR